MVRMLGHAYIVGSGISSFIGVYVSRSMLKRTVMNIRGGIVNLRGFSSPVAPGYFTVAPPVGEGIE